MKKLFLIIILFSFSLLLADEVDSLQIRRIYHIEGIKVIAERMEQTIGSVEVEEIKENIPELNIAQSVEAVNGIDLYNGGKSGSEIRIRGFENDQIKIMLDGRPLGGGYFGNVDLSTIPVSEIDKIQILKGPVSALYGSDTMGGVINIITKSPQNDHWLKIGSKFKRNNTNKIHISSSRSFANWDYWIYAAREHSDGFMLSEDFIPTNNENGAIRDFSRKNQYDLQSKLNFTIADFHSIGVQAGYTFMDEKQIPSSIYENELREFIDWKRYQFSVPLSLQLRHNITSKTNAYFDAFDDTYAEYNPATGEMYSIWPSYLKSNILGINQQFDWQVNEILLTSLGHRFEQERYNRKDNGNYPEWTSNSQINNNSFLQGEFDLNKLKITVGSGLSFFKQSDRKNWIANFEPSAGIYYENNDNWKYAFAISSNTKFPSLHELFSSSSGNSELIEEKALKSEFTFKLPFSRGSYQQAFFYNKISNLIDKVDGTYTNLKKVDSYGYEMSLNLKLLLEHHLSFSHIEYKNSNALLETPENTFSIEESLNIPFNSKLIYKARWKDIRKTEEKTILPSYWLNSAYLEILYKKINLLLGLENIFDVNYQSKYGFPGEGVNFVISIETKL